VIRDLPEGQWYGNVERSLELGGVTLSVIGHPEARTIDLHRHARSYFTLPYAGRYRETYEGVTIEYEPFSMAFHPADSCIRMSFYPLTVVQHIAG
jgi:hypothetical protein